MKKFFNVPTIWMTILSVASFIALLFAGETLAVFWVIFTAVWAGIARYYQMLFDESEEENTKRIEALKTERDHYLKLYNKYRDMYHEASNDAVDEKE